MTLLKKTAIAILAATTFAQANTLTDTLSGFEILYSTYADEGAIGYTHTFDVGGKGLEFGFNLSNNTEHSSGDHGSATVSYTEKNYAYHLGLLYPIDKNLVASIGYAGSTTRFSDDDAAEADENPETNGLYGGIAKSFTDGGEFFARVMIAGEEKDSHGHKDDTYFQKLEMGYRF